MCFLGNKEAMEAEKKIVEAERVARRIVNSTEAHKAACREISAHQPEYVRRCDNFLALID